MREGVEVALVDFRGGKCVEMGRKGNRNNIKWEGKSDVFGADWLRVKETSKWTLGLNDSVGY